MFRNLFLAAVLAALCAGLINSAIQYVRVIPIILAAEAYESDDGHEHAEAQPSPLTAAPTALAQAAAPAPHVHDPEQWAPQDGAERTGYTMLANLLVAAGFALVIGAVSMFANIPITFANGVLWGVGGFAVFQLAPAFGLAPELPGMPAADVFPRQLWWAGTALATGAALVLVAKIRAPWAFAIAVALIVLPHIIGAPQPESHESGVPAFLAASFAANALGAAAVFWVVLGLAFGRLNDYFAAQEARS